MTHAAKYGLLERLLTRSGILPALRQRVRDDIEKLIPQMMVPPLLRHFAPHIREFYVRECGPERGKKLAAIPHEATGGRLVLQRSGYHLDPHLDPRRVLFTTLIYFARGTVQRNTHRPSTSTRWSAVHPSMS